MKSIPDTYIIHVLSTGMYEKYLGAYQMAFRRFRAVTRGPIDAIHIVLTIDTQGSSRSISTCGMWKA
jgi:hypothetical protein